MKSEGEVIPEAGAGPGRAPYSTPRLVELGNIAKLVEAMGVSQVEGASGMIGMPGTAGPFDEPL